MFWYLRLIFEDTFVYGCLGQTKEEGVSLVWKHAPFCDWPQQPIPTIPVSSLPFSSCLHVRFSSLLSLLPPLCLMPCSMFSSETISTPPQESIPSDCEGNHPQILHWKLTHAKFILQIPLLFHVQIRSKHGTSKWRREDKWHAVIPYMNFSDIWIGGQGINEAKDSILWDSIVTDSTQKHTTESYLCCMWNDWILHS